MTDYLRNVRTYWARPFRWLPDHREREIMLNTVSIAGYSTEDTSKPADALYEDLTRVTVQGPDSTEYPGGSYVAEDNGPWESECQENPPADDTEDQSTYGPHVRQYAPLSWLNHASIRLDESEDDVTVTISAGDPSGAFTFSVHRVTDKEHPNYGKLVLIMPYSGQSGLHMPMTQIAEGGYVLG